MAGDATAPDDDYDRACAVDDLAGVIAVWARVVRRHWCWRSSRPPAAICPSGRAFPRWLAADSATGSRAAAEAVLTDPATAWETCGTWVSDGPAVLMDSPEAESELDTAYPGGGMPAQAPVPLRVGPFRVLATHTKTDGRNRVGLVRILPVDG